MKMVKLSIDKVDLSAKSEVRSDAVCVCVCVCVYVCVCVCVCV